MSVTDDDPILTALEEEFAELGVEQGPLPAPQEKEETMLPTEKTPAKMSLSDLTVLVHGPAKIGKSELCSHAEKALFLATEAGLNALEVYQVPISTWNEFLAACGEIARGEHGFKTIVVDTLDNLYRMCSEHVCARQKIQHESDLGYGKGFALVNNEFHRALNKLSLLPYGLFLICHSQEREIETRTGKRTRIVPTLSDKARRMVLGMVDVILYCDAETVVDAQGKAARERRVMRTKPTEAYEAGDRTGRLPDVIDLDYGKFVEAFERAVPAQAPVGEAPSGGRAPEERVPEEQGTEEQAPEERASIEQVTEFADLTGLLEVPPEVMKQRLSEYGVAKPGDLSRSAMEAILVKLRAARDAKAEAPAA
ncbi:MAG: ATP-binding protein [Planctomycetota bacterium]|jgi:hypothetical protein